MDIFKHKDFSRLHFGHRWLTHFGFVSGFLRLCHAFFERGFILRFGTYWQSSSFGRCISCFGHFVLMCRLLTFLFHSNNTSSFFLPVSFNGFWQENYVSMWGHYGSRVMIVYSGSFGKVLGPITNLIWWYKLYFYGRLCFNCFFRELGFGGFVFMFKVLYFW
jgi:hypothetical protein